MRLAASGHAVDTDGKPAPLRMGGTAHAGVFGSRLPVGSEPVGMGGSGSQEAVAIKNGASGMRHAACAVSE